MPVGQKYRFNWSTKSDLEKCQEWVKGKKRPSRKEGECRLDECSVCEENDDKTIGVSEWYWVNGNPQWIAHIDGVENYLKMHSSGSHRPTESKPTLQVVQSTPAQVVQQPYVDSELVVEKLKVKYAEGYNEGYKTGFKEAMEMLKNSR